MIEYIWIGMGVLGLGLLAYIAAKIIEVKHLLVDCCIYLTDIRRHVAPQGKLTVATWVAKSPKKKPARKKPKGRQEPHIPPPPPRRRKKT